MSYWMTFGLVLVTLLAVRWIQRDRAYHLQLARDCEKYHPRDYVRPGDLRTPEVRVNAIVRTDCQASEGNCTADPRPGQIIGCRRIRPARRF